MYLLIGVRIHASGFLPVDPVQGEKLYFTFTLHRFGYIKACSH